MCKGLKMHYFIVKAEHITLPLEFDDARMVAACAYSVVHDMTFVLPGTLGTVTHGIADTLGAAGGCKRQIVVSVMLPYPRSLLIILNLGMLDNRTGKRYHSLTQWIRQWPVRAISYQHAYSMTVYRTVHKKLAVRFDHLLCPGSVIA